MFLLLRINFIKLDQLIPDPVDPLEAASANSFLIIKSSTQLGGAFFKCCSVHRTVDTLATHVKYNTSSCHTSSCPKPTLVEMIDVQFHDVRDQREGLLQPRLSAVWSWTFLSTLTHFPCRLYVKPLVCFFLSTVTPPCCKFPATETAGNLFEVTVHKFLQCATV